MNVPFSTIRVPLRENWFIWDKRYTERHPASYITEDAKLDPKNHQSIIEAFFNDSSLRLDPPDSSYAALRNFLSKVDEAVLRTVPFNQRHHTPLILLDQRRDTTGWRDIHSTEHRTRNWDDYSNYPPEGESIAFKAVNAGDLYRQLLRSVRRSSKACR